MIYLVIGADARERESRVSELKSQYISGKDFSFDYEVLYGNKLEPDTLRKALLALPVFSSQRFVLLRECHKLTEHNRDLVLDFARGKTAYLVMVMESDSLKPRDKFVEELKPFAKIVVIEEKKQDNIFDVTRAMSRRQQTQALQILNGILMRGDYPPQILGALLWFWGDIRDTLSRENFEEGLRALQDADLNIKRSRLKADHALEVLVVKLCVLMD